MHAAPRTATTSKELGREVAPRLRTVLTSRVALFRSTVGEVGGPRVARWVPDRAYCGQRAEATHARRMREGLGRSSLLDIERASRSHSMHGRIFAKRRGRRRRRTRQRDRRRRRQGRTPAPRRQRLGQVQRPLDSPRTRQRASTPGWGPPCTTLRHLDTAPRDSPRERHNRHRDDGRHVQLRLQRGGTVTGDEHVTPKYS